MSSDFTTRWLAAVVPHLSPAAAREYAAGRYASPVLREALAAMALRHPVAVVPHTREVARAARELAAVAR